MFKSLTYAARTLAVLITAFFAVFILEGFGPDFTWKDSLAHLLVALVALTATVLAWKRPKAGGLAFLALGLGWLSLLGLTATAAAVAGAHLLAGALLLCSSALKRR